MISSPHRMLTRSSVQALRSGLSLVTQTKPASDATSTKGKLTAFGQISHVLKRETEDLSATAEADLFLFDGLAHEPGQAVLDEVHRGQAVGLASGTVLREARSKCVLSERIRLVVSQQGPASSCRLV